MSNVSSKEFPYFVYYQPTSNLDFLKSLESGAGKKSSKASAEPDLDGAVSRFRAKYITGKKAKLEIEAMPSVSGFGVYGATEASLEKLPSEFETFTRGDVTDRKPPQPCRM